MQTSLCTSVVESIMIADVYRIYTRFASIHPSFRSLSSSSCCKILTDALEVSHFTSELSYAMFRGSVEREREIILSWFVGFVHVGFDALSWMV
jgi:hypothetical protein